nr:MAG TPA: hypothetical protein [Caudoviricetes sp.]
MYALQIHGFYVTGSQEVSGSIPLISTNARGCAKKNPVTAMVTGFFLFAQKRRKLRKNVCYYNSITTRFGATLRT